MPLNQAIMHHKEHSKPYGKYRGTYAKLVDPTCRNHGSCTWCLENRIHSSQKKEYAMMDAIKDAEKEYYNPS